MLALVSPAAAAAPLATPYAPANEAVVVERLPAGLRQARAEAAGLAEPASSARASDPTAAARLALTWVERGRAEADLRLYGYARAALDPWWHMGTPPPAVRLPRALILQAHHDFGAAADDLDALLAAEPRNARAWLARAMIFLAQGRPRDALASCARLSGLVAPLVSAACAAGAAGRLGQGEAAYRLLAGRLAESDEADPPILVWALAVQAELAARLGDASAAEQAYRRALAHDGRDARLLAGYADLLLDQGRPAAVRDLLGREARSLGLRLRLALAERRLGDPGFEEPLAAIQAELETPRWRGEEWHLREAARFHLEVLDDPVGALDLAVRNWSLQREPADARLLVAAALAAGEPAAARPALEWVAKTGLQDHQLAGLLGRLVAEHPGAGS
jgi:hypothetical protein